MLSHIFQRWFLVYTGRATFALLCFAFVMTGCSSSGKVSRSRMATVDATQRSSGGSFRLDEGSTLIQVGDQIQISVWGYPEFSTTSTVKETGVIVIPLLGEMQAATLTKAEFTDHLKSRLAEFVKGTPQLTISIVSLTGMNVSVMGAVTRQDTYPLMGEVSLVEVLTRAGGATTGADLRHVRIYHSGPGRNFIEVDLPTRLENGDLDAIPKVRPGDVVYVPTEENVVRSLSDVARDILLLFGFFRILD